MLVVGLTGGIASGKSTVAAEFSQLGAAIIDADEIAHALVSSGKPALAEISHYFGPSILHDDGGLNRKKLRQLIFADKTKRIWLENLLHPLVYHSMQANLLELTSPYCLLVIPLLIETQPNPLIERILVVDVKPEIQRLRLLQREPDITAQELNQILDVQAKRQERLAKADDILHNEGSLKKLRQQVLNLHHYYRQLATI